MINAAFPADWRDAQNQVAKILKECEFDTYIEHTVQTLRGAVNIDVFAVDTTQQPPSIYLCECKHWRSAVPQTDVHAFRTVVHDYGANWGLFISSNGFQQGAYTAAQYTNVRLLSWEEFQQLFMDRWYVQYFLPQLYQSVDALVEYTEPVNSRIFRKVDALAPQAVGQFNLLRKKHEPLATLASLLRVPFLLGNHSRPALPLDESLPEEMYGRRDILPRDLLEAQSFRSLLEIYVGYITHALQEFDELFGERA